MTNVQRLKALLNGSGAVAMPGCHDALTARLAAQAGFRVALMSGFAVSAARIGQPDMGLISFGEMCDQLRNICEAVPELPVIGDGDTGFGNAMNVQRTVRGYARAGAAGIMVEDQVSPKKCGHTQGVAVIGRQEARMKVRAAVDAAAGADICVVARTDARSAIGFEAGLERCNDFAEEGADVVFMEAPRSRDEMATLGRSIDRPLMIVLVPGGKTPMLELDELGTLGFRLVCQPHAAFLAGLHAMRAAYAALAAGTALPTGLSFEELRELAGFPDYYAREGRFRAED